MHLRVSIHPLGVFPLLLSVLRKEEGEYALFIERLGVVPVVGAGMEGAQEGGEAAILWQVALAAPAQVPPSSSRQSIF